jgi:hypothetical protein
MKKYILIIAVLFCTSAQAQKVDTVKNAIQVKPVVIDALMKDTVFQLKWEAFGLKRKDTTGCNTYVQMFDRKGKQVRERNIPIPYSVTSVLSNDTIIDDYILKFLGLQKQ